MRKLISIIWEVVSYFIIKAVLFFSCLGMVIMFVVIPIAGILLTLFLIVNGTKGLLSMIILSVFFGVSMYIIVIQYKALSVTFERFKSITPLSERIKAVKNGESDIFERIKREFEPKKHIYIPFETFEPGGIASLKSDYVILHLINEYNSNNDDKIKRQILHRLKGVINVYIINDRPDNNSYSLSINGERGHVEEYVIDLHEIGEKKYIPIYTKSGIENVYEKGFFCEFDFDKLTKIMFVNFGACEYEFVNGRKRSNVVDGIIINPNTDNFIIETEIIRPLVRNPIVLNAWEVKNRK